MLTTPTKLVLIDIDGTLYKSPKAPNGDTSWYFQGKSLQPDTPGFDQAWYIEMVEHARRAVDDPLAVTAVITGRPDHMGMRKAVGRLLRLANLQPKHVLLQPVYFPGSTAQYKALATSTWLNKYPTVREVVLYDDEEPNHVAVRAVTLGKGKRFTGIVAPGW